MDHVFILQVETIKEDRLRLMQLREDLFLQLRAVTAALERLERKGKERPSITLGHVNKVNTLTERVEAIKRKRQYVEVTLKSAGSHRRKRKPLAKKKTKAKTH
jgi:hypothetical protein